MNISLNLMLFAFFSNLRHDLNAIVCSLVQCSSIFGSITLLMLLLSKYIYFHSFIHKHFFIYHSQVPYLLLLLCVDLIASVPECQSSYFCGTMTTLIKLCQIRESDWIEHGRVELKSVYKLQYWQTIVNLSKLDRISHVNLMCWVTYVCWDVYAVSNEVDDTFPVSLHCTRGQWPFCSSLVFKNYSLLPNSYHTLT